MVDRIRQKVLLIAALFIAAYIVSTSLAVPSAPHASSNKLEDSSLSDNQTTSSASSDLPSKSSNLRIFEGIWTVKGEGQLFNRIEHREGALVVQRREQGNDGEGDNTAIIYDGLWMSDEMYTIRFGNLSLMSNDNWKGGYFPPAKVYTRYGYLMDLQNFSGSASPPDSIGTIAGNLSFPNGFYMTFYVSELTVEMRKQPRVTYSFIISLLSTLQIFAFVKHSQETLSSEQQAKKTSKLFLFTNVVIDAALSIWHLALAFEELEAFDYLILAAFWNFASFLLLQSRAIAIIWRAHYTGTETTFEGIRHQYSLFYTKLCICIVLSLLLLFSLDTLSYWSVALLSWFFLPQILVSAIYGYRHALRPVVYLPLGLSRIIFILYIFGCPANFLRREPNYALCAGVSAFILAQMAVIHAQNSKLGPKFFVPRALRKAVYSYYRQVEEEANIEDTDCIICMTPLNLQGKVSEAEIINKSRTMHTPCGHRYHEDCLTQWMSIKMECPTCRSALPPLEEM